MRNDLILIASADRNWGLGINNQLLKRIPEDMRRFSLLTKGNLIIVGRKTLESFKDQKPLPERVNVVLSGNTAYSCEDAVIVHNLDELSDVLAGFQGEIYVCGGESVYRLLLPYCQKALITRIDGQYEADAFLPDFDDMSDWVKTSEEEWQTSKNGTVFRFIEYNRRP